MAGFIQSGRFGAPIVPPDIAGLQAWYDASDAASFTFSAGVAISAWADKSGNGHHLNSVIGTPPTRSGTQNGLATVIGALGGSIAGANSTIGTSTQTWCGVWRRTAVVGGQTFRFGNSSVGLDASLREKYTANGVADFDSTHSSSTSHAVVVWQVSGAGLTLYVDGVLVDSSAGLAIDAGVNIVKLFGETVAELAEQRIYDSILSAPDRQSNETYLKAKWGTP